MNNSVLLRNSLIYILLMIFSLPAVRSLLIPGGFTSHDLIDGGSYGLPIFDIDKGSYKIEAQFKIPL